MDADIEHNRVVPKVLLGIYDHPFGHATGRGLIGLVVVIGQKLAYGPVVAGAYVKIHEVRTEFIHDVRRAIGHINGTGLINNWTCPV